MRMSTRTYEASARHLALLQRQRRGAIFIMGFAALAGLVFFAILAIVIIAQIGAH